MSRSEFFLSWSNRQRSIFAGLCSLQQKGDFVDMTLAADGHFVKVHQLIMGLASPYLKELISSAAPSQHPVIFLNNISYRTLCSILEYIYAGEALVNIENIKEFLNAGKNLHIEGLDELSYEQFTAVSRKLINDMPVHEESDVLQNKDDLLLNDRERCHETSFEACDLKDGLLGSTIEDMNDDSVNIEHIEVNMNDDLSDKDENETNQNNGHPTLKILQTVKNKTPASCGTMQYTVSNQGSLQMILNRYMYYLKNTRKDNRRQWRCVDYCNKMFCPAFVLTKDDMIVKRVNAHKHPYHDARIMKKVKQGAVFSALQEAEDHSNEKE